MKTKVTQLKEEEAIETARETHVSLFSDYGDDEYGIQEQLADARVHERDALAKVELLQMQMEAQKVLYEEKLGIKEKEIDIRDEKISVRDKEICLNQREIELRDEQLEMSKGLTLMLKSSHKTIDILTE